MRWRTLLALATLSSIVVAQPPTQIERFVPEGVVGIIESVQVRFNQPAINFGDGQAEAPMQVSCEGAAVQGEGRWTDEQNWTYVFRSPPGPGVSCKAQVSPDFRTVNGQAISGRTEFLFSTGGPQVVSHRPYGNEINEDQIFVLQFNGAVDQQSLTQHTYCAVQGLGEAVPVRIIEDPAQRADVLEAVYMPDHIDDPAVQLIQCKRVLPADARIDVVIDAGISSRNGVASETRQTFEFQVRPPFKATVGCQRENANADCTPVLPVHVTFNAPVPVDTARQVRVQTSEEVFSPVNIEDEQSSVQWLEFRGPFQPESTLSVELPEGLMDDSGRVLSNADRFPWTLQVADYPPLVKFSSKTFGTVERFANVPLGKDESDYPATVPLTVRHVEHNLLARDLKRPLGTVRDYVAPDDIEVLRWYAALNRLEGGRWTKQQIEHILDGKQPGSQQGETIDARGYSVLKNLRDVRRLALPAAADVQNMRPLEVIGVPVTEPGFHVLEVESPTLGQALLGVDQPMYVRSGVLVTNLAVHLKRGRDDVLVWVTTLDEGKVVEAADIRLLDCRGNLLATGQTDSQGIWHQLGALDAPNWCSDTGLSGVYASARIDSSHPLARGKADFSFVLSDWDSGIESWRFNVPTETQTERTLLTHTVFDRSLLRAGETISMKHFARVQTRDGLAIPEPEQLPTQLEIAHLGSGQRYEQDIQWETTPSGGLSAQSTFALPRSARLGEYSVTLKTPESYATPDGSFRVEEFKLPVLEGSLMISEPQAHVPELVSPDSLNVDVQLSYLSGGPAADLPVTLSVVMRDKSLNFRDYENFSFDPPVESEADPSEWRPVPSQRLILDKQSLTLGKQGVARTTLETLPDFSRAADLLFEASFNDPNGQVQTLTQSVPVWPAAAVAGIRSGSWGERGEPFTVDALALSTDGAPLANVALKIHAVNRITYSSRQRMVGGFYRYEHHTHLEDLGAICEGRSDAQGLMRCEATIEHSGSIELIATATDEQGRASVAASTIWLMGADDLWFEAGNDDRIDIIPEKNTYVPGETAEFQIRMPFRQALALITVEREGVLSSQVQVLNGSDPRVRMRVEPEWGPNVYVSVLVLRGRLHEVPWYSFFNWGWKQPATWWGTYKDTEAYRAPSALIDLAKPAFRFGLTELRVEDQADRLQVQVTPAKTRYQIREEVPVDLQVFLPDGEPAAHGQVAFVAVDEALLELDPNDSWRLLEAMRQRHSYGVRTSTGQLQVVGRRHYGRKALPAGGGGGTSPTRELLDTLLIWKPDIQLDAKGRARVTIPLNDSITSFRLVAIADHDATRFGEGQATIVATQDVQVISGFPALVREGDEYIALATVRNTTEEPLKLEVSATYAAQGLKGSNMSRHTLELEPGEAKTVSWNVAVPSVPQEAGGSRLQWTLEAYDAERKIGDRLRFEQSVEPRVPVGAHQAALHQIEASSPLQLPVSMPAGAVVNADGIARGGIDIFLQSSLGGELPGVYQWFADYPYTCLEQLWSRAIGMRDHEKWHELMQRLPDHLDADGLAAYFPGARWGNEVLTAYLLSVSHEAQTVGLDFAIPDGLRQAMLDGLLRFAQGRITRDRWAPRNDLQLRKLIVLEALAREGRMRPALLDSIQIEPNRWPTSAVIDWMSILKRVPNIPQSAVRFKQAEQILQARMLNRGTELVFSGDQNNDLWWLMRSPQVDAARLISLVVDEPEWYDALPRLVQGLLGAQHNGAWSTTPENVLAGLALKKFAHFHEAGPVTGTASVKLDQRQPHRFDWGASSSAQNIAADADADADTDADADADAMSFKWPEDVEAFRVLEPWPKAGSGVLEITQQGNGTIWAWTRSMAAVPITDPIVAGFQIERELTPVSQAKSGRWSTGDVYRVRLAITARTEAVWAVIDDPIPAGATVLGSALGRDSSILSHTNDALSGPRPSFIERSFSGWRAYYQYLPKGVTEIEYTVRLNSAGRFGMPPTRVEALYQPDVFGVLPQSPIFEIHVR